MEEAPHRPSPGVVTRRAREAKAHAARLRLDVTGEARASFREAVASCEATRAITQTTRPYGSWSATTRRPTQLAASDQVDYGRSAAGRRRERRLSATRASGPPPKEVSSDLRAHRRAATVGNALEQLRAVG
jgi:hypothetical protein